MPYISIKISRLKLFNLGESQNIYNEKTNKKPPTPSLNKNHETRKVALVMLAVLYIKRRGIRRGGRCQRRKGSGNCQ